jgi:ribosome-associated protein
LSLTSDQFKKLAILAARQADQKKAENIALLDLKKTDSTVTDYLLILSATSEVHLKTLRDSIEDILDQMQMHPTHQDGVRGGHWAVLDYGGLMIHIFHEKVRGFYSLERLWEDAREIPWQPRHEKTKERKDQSTKSRKN